MWAGRAILVGVAMAGAVSVSRAQQGPPPQFRAEINYVQVDARVLDERGQPIRNLTEKDFAIFEDGVRQTLTNFSIVDIPMPTATGETAPSAAVKPDVVVNTQGDGKRRTYLVFLDSLSIDPTRTAVVRTFLRRFIERSIGPDDVVGIATTGCDATYENFTSDKPRLIAAVNRVVGQGQGSPTINALTPSTRTNCGNSTDDPAGARRTQRQLMEIIHAMSGAGSGSRAIIFVSEGFPFETVSNTEGVTLLADVDRVSAQARRSNVPVYPVDPRGLSSGFDDAIQGAGLGVNTPDPAVGVLTEVRRAQDRMRFLADDSGGSPIVGVNDIDGGLDRIVTLSSFYYELGYYSTNSRRDGKYRKINVTVDRPGARVLNRRGYNAAVTGAPKPPSLAGPQKSSYELREALNAVLPTAGLPLEMTAAAFRQTNGRASVAAVLETSGAALTWQGDALAAPLEMTAVAMEKNGGIKAGDVNRLQLSTRSDTADRIRQFGYRWLARLDDLKPGHYQIRGAAANGPEKQGSVWYDVEIPDFSKNALAMSDVVLASQVAMLRPTLRPDVLLADGLPGPPTTLREFPEGGTVAIYAEVYDNQLDRPHDIEASVVVTNQRGEIAFRTVETRTDRQLAESHGVFRVKAGIPLVNIGPGSYTLTVDARQTVNRAVSAGRAVPFQVVRATGK